MKNINLIKIIYYIFTILISYVCLVIFFYFLSVYFFYENKAKNIWPIRDFQIHYYFISGERMIWNGMKGCSKSNIKTIYEPVKGHCKNHKNIEYNVSYTFDEYGRIVPNRINKKNKGIAILGDSVAMGFGVNDHETFSNQLQILIKNIPVYNLGVESFSTKREIEYYINSMVYEKTDTVIFTYHQNDLEENIINPSKKEYEDKTKDWEKHKTTVIINSDLRTKLSMYKQILIYSINLFPRTFVNLIKKEPRPWLKNYEKNFEIHYLNFIKIFSEYEKFFENKKVLFIYVNEWSKKFDNYKTGKDDKFSNLKFLKINLSNDDYYIIDDHLNINGHRSIAEQLYKELQKIL